MKKQSKKDKVRDMLSRTPNMPSGYIADRVGCSYNYVNQVRQTFNTQMSSYELDDDLRSYLRDMAERGDQKAKTLLNEFESQQYRDRLKEKT